MILLDTTDVQGLGLSCRQASMVVRRQPMENSTLVLCNIAWLFGILQLHLQRPQHQSPYYPVHRTLVISQGNETTIA